MNKIIYAGCAPFDGSKNHNHKGYEVCTCSARGEIVTTDGVYNFKKGEVAVIPPLVRHFNTGSGSSTAVHVLLEQALLPVREVTLIRGSGAEELTCACGQAERVFNDGFGRKEIILDALGGLIAALIAAYTGGEGYSPVVKTVMNEIEKNKSDPTCSLEDILRAVPLNYDYVRKLFKKETGVTPHEYLVNSRMDLAKNIILSGISNQYSNYTVSQIAEMCGFAEPLYFSRVFKKRFGVSPSEYGKK